MGVTPYFRKHKSIMLQWSWAKGIGFVCHQSWMLWQNWHLWLSVFGIWLKKKHLETPLHLRGWHGFQARMRGLDLSGMFFKGVTPPAVRCSSSAPQQMHDVPQEKNTAKMVWGSCSSTLASFVGKSLKISCWFLLFDSAMWCDSLFNLLIPFLSHNTGNMETPVTCLPSPQLWIGANYPTLKFIR